ncbi:hypothetical protein C8J55DRAFT_439669, partial [Lentinula edodes]
QHTSESIKPIVEELRPMFPNAGIKEMKSLLFHERDMAVSKHVLIAYFKKYEPHLIKARKARRLKRKQFIAAGVNDLYTMDQHDKWKYKLGLCLHICLDPFTGVIKWLKIWWNNSNPVLIVSYYIEAVRANKGVTCLVTQSDAGTENVGVANAHTTLRHYQDPSLEGTIQHRYMLDKKNVMPEIEWSQLRRRWTPGFEDLMDYGVAQGWYSRTNTLENLVFRWVFIPWLQAELDIYRDRRNNTIKRHDKNKVLPHGVPAHIESSPESYGSFNFGVQVEDMHIAAVEKVFAPTDHPVFQLVPSSFAEMISQFYAELGSPQITRSNVWDVYNGLLSKFRGDIQSISTERIKEWEENCTIAQDDEWGRNSIEKMAGEPLSKVPGYWGGVNGGSGPGMWNGLRYKYLLTNDEPQSA